MIEIDHLQLSCTTDRCYPHHQRGISQIAELAYLGWQDLRKVALPCPAHNRSERIGLGGIGRREGVGVDFLHHTHV